MNDLRGAQIDGFVVLGEVVHDRVLAYREDGTSLLSTSLVNPNLVDLIPVQACRMAPWTSRSRLAVRYEFPAES